MADEEELDETPFESEEIRRIAEMREETAASVEKLRLGRERSRKWNRFTLWLAIGGSAYSLIMYAISEFDPVGLIPIGIYAVLWATIAYTHWRLLPRGAQIIAEGEEFLTQIDGLIAIMIQFNELTSRPTITYVQAMQFQEQLETLAKQIGKDEDDDE